MHTSPRLPLAVLMLPTALSAAGPLPASRARAQDPPLHRLDHLDARASAERPAPEAAPSPAPPLWISLAGKVSRRDDGRREVGGTLLVGLPLGRVATPSRDRPGRLAKSPGADEDFEGELRLWDDSEVPTSPVPPDEAPLADEGWRGVLVTPADARATVRAALRAAGIGDPDDASDNLGARAKASALLPELRLRVTRLVDEDERLSPTEYDPDRLMASGGTSLWLEARATWTLDRLVFADEEVALERLRSARARARLELVEEVATWLGRFQSASARARDPQRAPEARFEAALQAEEAALRLDVLTAGFFSQLRGPAPVGDHETATSDR